MPKENKGFWRKRTHLPRDLIMIPQEALHRLWSKIWKLRAMVMILVVLCTALAMIHWEGRETVTRLSLLEAESRAKDAAIEELEEFNKVLEERLTFRLKVDDLVSRIQKEAPWLDRKAIRAAAEKALCYTTDPGLYLAIALVETGLKANVVHADGVALGMHGLCPRDWHNYLKAKGIMKNRNDYFDPVKSFKGSEAVLSALIRECGSLEKALRYYNGGEAAADGKIPKSTAYAKRILHLRKLFTA